MSAETAATKRQYAAVDIGPGAGSSASEGASRAAPKQKTTAATKKATAKKAPTVDKLYNNSIKKIEAAIKTLDGRVLKMGPDSNRVTTDSYAKMSLRHLKSVKELDQMDGGLVPAFNLMLYVADASHTDCDTTGGKSGFGDSEAPFGLLDMQLLELIEKRHVHSPAIRQEELPSVLEQWKRPVADVLVLSYEWLIEQHDTETKRQKLGREQDRREKRHERRVVVDDWVAVALQELEGERDYLEENGITKYFPKSIERLTELMGSGSSTASAAPAE